MTIGQAADFLQGGGEMGARLRALDWTAHPLGPPAGWPQPLQGAVRLALATAHPVLILWGPALHCLYNDAFARSLGPENHPAMLGASARAAWTEAWPVLGGDVERVLEGGGSVYREDKPVPMRRHGHVADAYWSYGFSPIDDGAGGVGGVLALCTETTARMLETRRRDTDRERQQRLFEQAPGFIIIMRGPDHIVEFVNDAHRALFASEDWVGKTIRRAFPSIEGQGFFQLLDQVYASGETHAADGVPLHFQRAPGGPEQLRYLTFIYAPLFGEDGRVNGVFCEGFDVSRGKHAEIRHAALVELGDRLRDTGDPGAIADAAAETLARTLGVTRAGYGTVDIESGTVRIERDWNAPGSASLAGTEWISGADARLEALKRGELVAVEDIETDPRTAEAIDWLREIGARSFVNMPVTEQGGVVALLFLNHRHARSWSEDELSLIREVGERTRSAIARREAEQAVARNEARLRFLDALGKATATAPDADAVMRVTTRMLGAHLDISDCAYADMDPDEDGMNIRGDWHRADVPSIVGRYSLAQFGPRAIETLRAGRPLVIADNIAELGEDGARAFLDIGVRATICMPFHKGGRLSALMAIHDAAPHAWSDDELGLLREVTERSWAHIERIRAERALRESEGRLRLAVEGARIGTWDWDLVTMQPTWSERTIEIFGPGSAELLTLEGRFELVHPDDRDWVREAFSRSIATGEPFVAEYRIVTTRGDTRWVASRGMVLRDESGRPVRTIGTIRDVTGRREAQDTLETLNQTLEQQVAERTAERDRMWRLSGDLFLVVGLRGEVRAANPALTALLGFAAGAVVGERLARFVHPDDLHNITRVLRAASQGPVRDFAARLRTRDGGWRRFAFSAAPGEGEAYVIARDITEEVERREALERTQEALRQSQKMESLGQLTGGVAHDFNNLLTPIIGSLDLLRRKLEGPRDQRLIGAALESAERARVLVQRLLAFARRQPLQPGPVDIVALVRGMSDLVASTSGPQIALSVDLAEPLPPALADANQLEMAILNLAVNARDAMPGGGRLSIAAREEAVGPGHRSALPAGRYVRLAVSDTGSGMDSETMARAIEPFFSTKGVGKGTGLGLSMVHGLASQLGGAMLLSSRPGLGTSVELLLPVAEAAPPRRAPRAGASVGGAGTVLLVDDEDMVRAATGALLADLGYQVIEAGDAHAALHLLAHNAIDYLVTDHLMPGMTGTELAAVARDRFPAIPVLIVSGYAELETISSDLPRLAKPFRQDELAAMMASLD